MDRKIYKQILMAPYSRSATLFVVSLCVSCGCEEDILKKFDAMMKD